MEVTIKVRGSNREIIHWSNDFNWYIQGCGSVNADEIFHNDGEIPSEDGTYQIAVELCGETTESTDATVELRPV